MRLASLCQPSLPAPPWDMRTPGSWFTSSTSQDTEVDAHERARARPPNRKVEIRATRGWVRFGRAIASEGRSARSPGRASDQLASPVRAHRFQDAIGTTRPECSLEGTHHRVPRIRGRPTPQRPQVLSISNIAPSLRSSESHFETDLPSSTV